MAIFPKIQSPCPFKNKLATIMDGDVCRQCKRQVFDLNAMSDEVRIAFMADCETEVCVTYRLPAGPILAAAIAAAALATPGLAAAQDAVTALDGASAMDILDDATVVGGIKDLTKVTFIELREDRAIPDLPVVYEDAPSTKTDLPAKVRPPAAS